MRRGDWPAACHIGRSAALPANHRYAVGLLPLPREEFRQLKFILHSEYCGDGRPHVGLCPAPLVSILITPPPIHWGTGIVFDRFLCLFICMYLYLFSKIGVYNSVYTRWGPETSSVSQSSKYWFRSGFMTNYFTRRPLGIRPGHTVDHSASMLVLTFSCFD